MVRWWRLYGTRQRTEPRTRSADGRGRERSGHGSQGVALTPHRARLWARISPPRTRSAETEVPTRFCQTKRKPEQFRTHAVSLGRVKAALQGEEGGTVSAMRDSSASKARPAGQRSPRSRAAAAQQTRGPGRRAAKTGGALGAQYSWKVPVFGAGKRRCHPLRALLSSGAAALGLLPGLGGHCTLAGVHCELRVL